MAQSLGRRTFLSQLAASGLMAGMVPSLDLASRLAPSKDGPSNDGPFIAPAPSDPDDQVFADVRKRFYFPADVAYCNTGTLGAIPRDTMEVYLGRLQNLEDTLPEWDYSMNIGGPLGGYQKVVDARTVMANFLNASVDEVAFTQNTTMGTSFLGNGLEMEAGDEVLTSNLEHVGGLGGFELRAKRNGIVIKQVRVTDVLDKGPDAVVQLFADAMTPKTKVVLFSHITSQAGILLPAKELCAMAHDHGALALIDGAQSVGQMRIDMKAIGCDAFANSTHKWLMAPKGTGILYIRKEVQDRFWATLSSSTSVNGADDHTAGAYRFMHFGTYSPAIVDGLQAAVNFASKIGIDRIERRDRMLTTYLRAGLAKIPTVTVNSPADPRFAAAITNFVVKGRTPKELLDALWTQKIRVRVEGPGVRFSTHYYVSTADIDRALEVTASLKPGPAAP